ncbi:MAG: gamma-glutamyl-gamma-aminobutyrate hydrolase family protein [Planctomycetaceae bacterium]
MNTKPLIGINGDFRPGNGSHGSLSWFNSGYYQAVIAAGGVPILIPPVTEDDDLKQILNGLDGIVLSGCALDLDPIRMGMDLHPSTKAMPRLREDFDRRLATLAVDMRIPMLAIGLGMQVVNVVCGGTLHQHLIESVPGALHHHDAVEKNLRHVLDIVPGTRVDAIYGPGEIRVNSQHHMSLNKVATPFKVSATCPDGVVEAYESIDESWFCLGVQWHPESDTASALDRQVFDLFLEACQTPEEEATVPFHLERRAA